MEEKKVIKISLSTFFLILAIIVILVMGIFICKFYNEKIEANKKSSELEAQVNKLKGTLSNNESSKDSTSFTEEQVKTTLSNFLELQAHANCDALLENLTEKGKLNYNASKNTVLDDGTVVTNIKFFDYKNAMLNYVSESEFEKNWSSTKYFKENSNGYLTKVQGGGDLRVYTIESITKNNNLTYSAKTTSVVDNVSNEDEEFVFTVKSYDGKCVIDTITNNLNKDDITYTISIRDEIYATISATKNGEIVSKEFEMASVIDKTGTIEIENIGKVALVSYSGGEARIVHVYKLINDEIKLLGNIDCGADMVKEATYTVDTKNEDIAVIKATINNETITKEFQMTAAIANTSVIDIFDYGKVVLVAETSGEYYGTQVYRLSQDYTTGKTKNIQKVGFIQ